MAQFRQQHHYLNGISADHVSIGIRTGPAHKGAARLRRSTRPDKPRRLSIGSFIVFVLSVVLFATILAYHYVSGVNQTAEVNGYSSEDEDSRKDLDFVANITRTNTHKILKFGHGSTAHGRDSRYWDRDDRRRDNDYDEDSVEQNSLDSRAKSLDKHSSVNSKFRNNEAPLDPAKGSDHRVVGLYNEAGRNELKIYEAEYEASLDNSGSSGTVNKNSNQMLGESSSKMHGEEGGDDYNDDIDGADFQIDDDEDSSSDKGTRMDNKRITDEDESESLSFHGIIKGLPITKDDEKASKLSKKAQYLGAVDGNVHRVSSRGSKSAKTSRSDPKRKSKRHSCEMLLLNSTVQLVEPLETRKFVRFSLQYTEMEGKQEGVGQWEPRFSGHQSLQEQEGSFVAHDQRINCGFIKGPKGSSSTGFDLTEDDTNYISMCHIAVISCIFGNSDRLRLPVSKMVTRLSRKNVCFVMFMDQITLQTLSSEGQSPDRSGFIGLWRIVVVKNLPYDDMRRVGKIPKLLPHRLFPSARYSIWLDSKLRLQLDPLLILEYFLWRKGHEYAISNHYDRHCVWEEVAQNKKLNKYNHTVIDEQFAFYQADGLKRFNASDPEKLLPSNVPEGSLIVRAHTPMSNLFSCLWFNEVDRFTPRDQLSFAYTYQKLRRMNPGKPFYLNMFKDCERRKVAKLFRHRSEEKRNVQQEVL